MSNKHLPNCRWELTKPEECDYKDTHFYCPHPDHACTCEEILQNSSGLSKDSKKIESTVERGEDGRLKPGSILNPKGKPKGTLSFKASLEKWADEMAEDDENMTQLDFVTKKLMQLASAGNVQAIREIADRLDGKARQTIDATIDSRLPIDPDKQNLMNEALRDMFKKK